MTARGKNRDDVAWSGGDPAHGQALYATHCAICHGGGGAGDGIAAPLNPKPRDFSVGDFKYDTDKDGKPGTDADLANIVKNGAGAYGGSPLMAPWGHLSDADIQNVVAYVRSLKK